MKKSPAKVEKTPAKVETHDTEVAPTPNSVKKLPKNYTPSSSLTKVTQARMADKKELEARKDRVKDEDDIWWSVRNNVENHKYKNDKLENVHSKFLQPTTASKVAVRSKHTTATPSHEPEKHIAPIDADNALLRPTKSNIHNQWKVNLNSTAEIKLK
jgi:hypothetical protein